MRPKDHRPAIAVPVVVFVFFGLLCAAASSIIAVLIPDGGQHAPRVSARHDLADGNVIYAFRVNRPGYRLISVTGPVPKSVADALDEIRSQEIPTREGDPRPRWLRNPAMPDPQTSRGIAAGWPLPCFWGRVDRNVNHRPQQVQIGIAEIKVAQAVRSFPMRPIWSRVVLNTLFYAALWLVLWFALVYAKRAWRSRRGRCPNCAYPKQDRSDCCPECGMPLQPMVAGARRTGSA